jgi:hypothetical protein
MIAPSPCLLAATRLRATARWEALGSRWWWVRRLVYRLNLTVIAFTGPLCPLTAPSSSLPPLEKDEEEEEEQGWRYNVLLWQLHA